MSEQGIPRPVVFAMLLGVAGLGAYAWNGVQKAALRVELALAARRERLADERRQDGAL